MENEMKQNDVILSVNDLHVSFKTDDGLVHAVRGVSYDLHKGETLCIVGESGSGKSVTSKTIMGILSKNAVIESGSIMYEGEDLTKIEEKEFHRIRGHKIGMIFQDPLSSLNPIMKIGKQITEAMLVNSDREKLKYDALISKEEAEYRNLLVTKKNNILRAKAAIVKSDDSFDAQIRELEVKVQEAKDAKYLAVKPSEADLKKFEENILKAKEELNAKKPEILAKKKEAHKKYLDEYKKVVKEENAKYKEKAPILKKALDEKKVEAKAEIQTWKAELKTKLDDDVNKINSKIAEINASSLSDEDKKKEIDKLNAELSKVQTEYKANFKLTRAEAKARALEVMREVGIPQPEERFKQYPFEFSGGMRQRIVIAIALTANPEVLICDEPTTALDVTIQAQILELINKLKKERNMSIIFITHDLGVVANMADRVAVMYAGRIVEVGKVNEIFYDPRHPYTWALLSSIPDLDSHESLEAIPGTPPYLLNPPKGDAFAARNKYALAIDYKVQPPFFKVSDTHYAATWLLDKRAPSVEKPKIVTQRIKVSLKKAGIENVNEIK